MNTQIPLMFAAGFLLQLTAPGGTETLEAQQRSTRQFADWEASYQVDLMTDEKIHVRLRTPDLTGSDAQLEIQCSEGSIGEVGIKYDNGWGGSARSARVSVRFDRASPEAPEIWRFGNLEEIPEEANIPRALERTVTEQFTEMMGFAARARTVRSERAREFVRSAMPAGRVAFEVGPFGEDNRPDGSESPADARAADPAYSIQHLFSLRGLTAALDWTGCTPP